MKKFLAAILGTITVFATSISVFAEDGIIKNGRTLVPVRGVFESLGFTVDWDAAANKAVISDGIHDVSLIKDMKWFRADGQDIFPDVPQQLIDGKFYLPLRAIGDAIGAETSWDDFSKTAHISYNGNDVYVKCTVSKADVKYYPGTKVPDFGACYGISPIKTETSNTNNSVAKVKYTYDTKYVDDIKPYEQWAKAVGMYFDGQQASYLDRTYYNSKNYVYRTGDSCVWVYFNGKGQVYVYIPNRLDFTQVIMYMNAAELYNAFY